MSDIKLINCDRYCDICGQLAQNQIIWKDINKLNTLLCNNCLEITKIIKRFSFKSLLQKYPHWQDKHKDFVSVREIMTKNVKKIKENIDFDKEFFDYCEKLVSGAYQKIWSKK